MEQLKEHLVVPGEEMQVVVVPVVGDAQVRRSQLIYAPTEYVRIIPYAFSYWRFALYVLLVLATGGILGIVSVWFPQLFTQIARWKLPYSRVGEADFMLALVHEDGFRSTWVEVRVHRPMMRSSGESVTGEARTKLPWVWFEFKKHRYVFNHEKGEFERYLATINEDVSRIHLRLDAGLDPLAAQSLTEIFGPNVVDIAKPRIPMLLFTKIVHPYYLFQAFSATVWFFQQYTVYAIVIIVLSVTSLTFEIYNEVTNSNRLRSLVRSDYKVQVFRAGAASESKMITLHETDLVPGDIIELTTGPVVADALLLTGSCVVDEASLTGEAIPINKDAARGRFVVTDAEARKQLKGSFLHAGSTITRVRDAAGPCKAVVLSTGFSTGKGELFRSIIFPRPITFEFERDSYRYLAVLVVIALAAFTKRLVDFANDGYDFGHTLVNSLDLITIAVPPALPLILSVGVGFALDRLSKNGIFCIDSQRINSCGQLTTFCFDKTGTLTKENLTFAGVDALEPATNTLFATKHDLSDVDAAFRSAMLSCHSLSIADDGNLQGYELEKALFSAVHGEEVHDKTTTMEQILRRHGVTVVERYPFDPAYQRSSVIVDIATANGTSRRFLFVKGSAEAIAKIAVALPASFKQKTHQYAADGNYCIAFGSRALGVDEKIPDRREALEVNVQFMGIARFTNELKPESKGMLHELYEADVDVRMITGDHALTAVHVARELEMKRFKSQDAIVDVDEATGEVMFHGINAVQMDGEDHVRWEPFNVGNFSSVLAQYDVSVTGAALERLKTDLPEELMKELITKTVIFARIRPQEKAWIVEKLADYGHVVGMCGDGTNDCGALKAAHVGLALSRAEASIVAPFTSREKAVTDVPALIREGRCALTTSFLGFKFMVLYPVIQLGMASTLGHVGTMMTNNQYLWDDMAIVLGMAIAMLYTGSSNKLSRERPPNTLFSLTIVLSILGQIVLYVAFFAGSFVLLTHQDWFCARDDGMTYVKAFMQDPASVSAALPDPSTVANCAFYENFVDQVSEAVDDIEFSHEDTVIWLFCHMAYFCVAAAFNIKDKFRLPFYTNKIYTLLFVASLGVNLWFLLDPSNTIMDSFQTLPLVSSFRIKLFLLFVGHMVAALLWEVFATRIVPTWRMKHDDAKKAAAVKEQETVYVAIPDASVESEYVNIQSTDAKGVSMA